MEEFRIDYATLANKALIHQVKKEDPLLGDLLCVFDAHDIRAAEAFVIMNEIYDVMNKPEVDAMIKKHDADIEALGDKLIQDLTNALKNSINEEAEEIKENKNKGANDND